MVSVIIPAYNCGSFIGETIQSVRQQTYTNWEIIVIDDGSTDDTQKVVGSIHDPRIRYIRTLNQGNYWARNRGLKEARGEYIAFLDADDIVLPEKFAKQVRLFMEKPELGLCCTNFYVQFADKDKDVAFEDVSYSFAYDFDTDSGFIEKALENNFIVTSSVMIRRECIERLGGFDTTFQNAMDYDLFLRIIFEYPSYYISEKLMKRLEHASNISKNKVNTYKALLYIFSEKAAGFSKGKLYKPQYASLVHNKWKKSMYYLGLEYLVAGNYPDAYQCLTDCQYSEKHLFRVFARFAARTKSPFLTSFIIFYRWKKQQQSIVASLLNLNPKALAGKSEHDPKRHYSSIQ
jgi:glycosyltransferase involved in cell wall biosynthesis